MPDLIESIIKDFPSDFAHNPFSYIIEKCMNFFFADYCSYLAPDYSSGKWQVKTCLKSTYRFHQIIDYPIELKVGKNPSSIESNDSVEAIPLDIEPGLCNLALYRKTWVAAEYVKDNFEYSQHYIQQFQDVSHEIAIPLISYSEGNETIIGVIVLDFCELEDFRSAKTKIQSITSVELQIGNLIYKRIYKASVSFWEKRLMDIAGLGKIDFDKLQGESILNDVLFSLWPKLLYYSIWACTADRIIDDPEKKFVRISYSFSDQSKNESYNQKCKVVDYILSENDKSTYGQTLKQALIKYRSGGSFYVRKRMASSEHKALSPEFKDHIYGDDLSTIRDFHFVPIVERTLNKDFRVETISFIFVFFFEDLGDSQLIKHEQIELMAQLLSDRIRICRHLKIKDLQTRIQNLIQYIFDDFKGFILRVVKNWFEVFPSQRIEIWITRDFRIDKYSLSGEKNDTLVQSDVNEETAIHILKNCLKERPAQIFNKNDSGEISDICLKCHAMKMSRELKSCMAVKVIGPKGKTRAILLFFNRKKLPTNVIQGFSILDKKAAQDIAGLLGLILSLYDAREEERRIKTVLPHEFASPVSILSNKLKEIDELLQQGIMSYVPDHRQELKGLLEKKISDCWYLCDTITYNSESYIKYIKKEAQVAPGPVNLNELTQHVLHLFTKKFNKEKRIYILIEGVSIYQKLQCHKPMLFSALHNVFDNTFKYSHRYSVFHVKVEEDASHILISFVNYGIGIDENELNSVFELYYQSKNIRKYYETAVSRSHGIGLPLAKWYIEKCHKGKIFFRSSRKIAPFNPFFLYIVKNIYNLKGVYKDTYRNDLEMLTAEPDDNIKAFFRETAVMEFFRIEKPLGSLGELLFREILQAPTYKNELVLIMPKKFRG